MAASRVIRLARVPECDIARGRAQESVHVKALQRACSILGSFDALAGHLGVEPTDLRSWLQGQQEPPERVFLATVEILLLAGEPPGASH